MKKRFGFVSNSSASSFTCDLCGVSETGWDFSGFEYENEAHTFCECCKGEIVKEEMEDSDYDISEKDCPFCKFEMITDFDLARFLLKEHGISREEVFAKIKEANKRRRKLYDHEYITYVYDKHPYFIEELLREIKTRYDNYLEFYKGTRVT